MADEDSVSSTSHGSQHQPSKPQQPPSSTSSPKKMEGDSQEGGILDAIRQMTTKNNENWQKLLEKNQQAHQEQIKQVNFVFILTAALVLFISISSSYWIIKINGDTPRRLDEAWAKITAMEETVKLQNDLIGRVYREVTDNKRKIDAISSAKQCDSASGQCEIDDSSRSDSTKPKLRLLFERNIESGLVDWLREKLEGISVDVVLPSEVASLNPGDATLYIHRLVSAKMEGFVDESLWKKVVEETNGNAIFTILRSGVKDDQAAIAAPFRPSGLSMDSSASAKPMRLEFRELNGGWYEPSSVNKLPELHKFLLSNRKRAT